MNTVRCTERAGYKRETKRMRYNVSSAYITREQKRMRYNVQSAYVTARTETDALQYTERVEYQRMETSAIHGARILQANGNGYVTMHRRVHYKTSGTRALQCTARG